MRSSQSAPRRFSGFTLLEILLALFIFVIVMSIITSGLGVAMRAERQVNEISDRLGRIQLAEAILSRDFTQIVNRPVLDVDGSLLPALMIIPNEPDLLEFTRAGVMNPQARAVRSTLLRVAYEFDQGRLIRKTWRVLDRAPTTVPDTRVILNDIKSITVRVLNKENEFVDVVDPVSDIPRAIQLEIDLGDRQFSRIMPIYGALSS